MRNLSYFVTFLLLAVFACWLWFDWYPDFLESQVPAAPDDSNLREQRGLFGDSYGAFNALITALAFAALVTTLVLQALELSLQRKELAQQKKEMAKTAAALQRQIGDATQRASRELTLRVHDRWTTMRDARHHAWEVLSKEFRGDEPVDFASFKASHKEAMRDFQDVCHFFSDLNKLLGVDVLDKELALNLLWHSVTPWFTYLDRLSFEQYESEGNDPQVTKWYQDHVMTVRQHFKGEGQHYSNLS